MNSISKKPLLATALIAAATIFHAAPAAAQATRTWVSGVGDDVNPCSRTAPCKTFAGAISKTAAGGEINCLDPGGFGAVTITKSIIIDCTGTFGSTLNSGVNGFIINDSATGTPGTVKVTLRGLSVDGAGTTPGLNGVRFISGASLILQDMIIQNSTGASGVSFQPAAFAQLFVNNVVIVRNGPSGGILVQPTGAGSAQVQVENSVINSNAGPGIKVDVTGLVGGGGVGLSANNVQSVGNQHGFSFTAPGGSTTPIQAMIVDSTIANNATAGILSNGTTVNVTVSNSRITNNFQGVTVTSGSVLSYGDNLLRGNGSNNTFAGTTGKL